MLSVREQRGKELIYELTGRDATVVLDPAIVMDTVFWDKIAKESMLQIQGEYVFVAEYAMSAAMLKDAERLATQLGLRIVCLYPPKGKPTKAKFFPSVSPQEYIYLIKNAKIVLSDSYHTTLFAINYQKDFYLYQTPTNIPIESRFTSLLSMLHLEDRFLTMQEQREGSKKVDVSHPIDYVPVKQILQEMRAVSTSFLEKVLQEKDM